MLISVLDTLLNPGGGGGPGAAAPPPPQEGHSRHTFVICTIRFEVALIIFSVLKRLALYVFFSVVGDVPHVD
jgi:hypothetical protein